MGRYREIIVCLAFGLGTSGCHIGSGRHTERVPDWESPESIAAAEAQRAVVQHPPIQRPRVATPKPAVQPVHTNFALNGWQSLDRWCALNDQSHLGVSPRPNGSAALETPEGLFLLSADSTRALWNGTEVRLGFAPHWENGQMLVHAADLEKVVRPLVQSESASGPQSPVVVIDPGHGGTDPGAHSRSGRFEKEFTLDWALRVAALLGARGWEVFCTRTNDTDVPLARRVDFAEQHHADLFVSLHFNSSGENHQRGIETYCLTPCGMKSNMNRGYEDDASALYPNNAFDGLNIALAYRVHAAALQSSGSVDRGVRHARFPAVLKNQNRPAILIEGGYLSSPEEAESLADSLYRQKLAEAVAQGISDYLKGPTREPVISREAGPLNRSSGHNSVTNANATTGLSQ